MLLGRVAGRAVQSRRAGLTGVQQMPLVCDLARGVASLAGGGSHSLAQFSDGTLRAWGAGNSGQLRLHDLKSSVDTVKGFDTDRTFGMVEIAGDQLYFQTVSRTGETVDAGVLPLIKAQR